MSKSAAAGTAASSIAAARCRSVARGSRHRAGLQQAGRFQAVNLVLRLHQLFFQREVDLLQAGLQFGQGEHALVHDRHAQRGLTGCAAGPYRELQRASPPGRYSRRRRRPDVQIVGGGDDDGRVSRMMFFVGQDFVGVDFQRSHHVGRDGQPEAAPARPASSRRGSEWSARRGSRPGRACRS